MPDRRSVAIASDTRTVTERILERAAAVADQAEVFHVASASTPVKFEANQVKAIDSNEGVGAAVRIIKDGRVGFASTSNLDDIDDLVAAAEETAPFGAEAAFRFPGAADYPAVPVFDSAVEDVSLEEMVDIGRRVIDELRSFSSEVQVEGGVSRSKSTLSLMNSNGGRFSYPRSGFRIGFEGTVIHGEDMLFTFDSASSVRPVTDHSNVTATIVRQLTWASKQAPVETKTMPVILMPQAVSSILLSPLLAGLSGKTVLQGTSPLAEKMGEKIVDERFSLTDDATLPYVPASRMSDDEGVPSRRLPLIDRGVVSTFLYDLQTAGLAGEAEHGQRRARARFAARTVRRRAVGERGRRSAGRHDCRHQGRDCGRGAVGRGSEQHPGWGLQRQCAARIQDRERQDRRPNQERNGVGQRLRRAEQPRGDRQRGPLDARWSLRAGNRARGPVAVSANG